MNKNHILVNKGKNAKGVGPKKFAKQLDLDDLLVNELGQFGRFQLQNIFLAAIPLIISPFINEYIFSAAPTNHRCFIPECENINTTVYDPEWIQGAIPTTDTGLSHCRKYAPIRLETPQCSDSTFNKSAIIDCEEFIYEKKISVVHDFNLGCQEWRRALAGTLNSVGTLVVLPITGYISDKYGRRMALVINMFNLGLFGLIRALSVNYPMYLATQLLQTSLGSGTFSTAYIFATELVGPKYRMAIGATCSAMFASGEMILGLVAWLIQPWRYMTVALFTPCFLIISYYWILSESVRWLLSKQKYDKARNVLVKVAKVNKKSISTESLDLLMSTEKNAFSVNSEKHDKHHSGSNNGLFQTIIKSPILMRRVCTTPIWWITTTFIYYGLSINSTSLSDTIYLNYILTSAIELPGFATAVIFVNRVGRKPTLAFGYFLCAGCNFAFAFSPKDMQVLCLVLYLLGKYGIAMVFTSLYMFTSELYPTEYRHTLLAFSSMVGRVGAIIAPITPVLTHYWDGIPSVLFGGLGLLAGLLILTQPETLGCKLPDTLAEAEALGQKGQRSNHKGQTT